MARRSTWLWMGALLLGAAAAVAWAFWPRPTAVEVGRVTQALFERALEEDCQTRLSERHAITAPVAAALARSSLRVGDAVQQGAVVARLQPLQPALLDARSRAEAQARVQAGGAGVQRARSVRTQSLLALQDAWSALQRDRLLAEQGFVAEARLDSARLAVSAARSALDAASADLERATQEQALARAALLGGGATSGGAAGQGPALLLRAPVSGVVLQLAQTDAVSVPAGALLLELGDLARMEVLCELLTSEAARIAPGHQSRIDYGAAQPQAAVVRVVEPAGFTKVSALGVEEQRVRVRLALLQPAAAWRRLGEGFRVTVRVLLQQQQDAIQVPVGALVPQGAGMAVFVVERNRVRLQPIALGERNASTAWVPSGLQPGQQVVLYPPGTLSHGQAVRVRAP